MITKGIALEHEDVLQIQEIRFAYRMTLLVAVLLLLSSTAGLVFGPRGWYDAKNQTYPALLGQDVLMLILTVPLLLVSASAAKLGSLRGLLCWMGALLYVAYFYFFNVLGARLSPLFPIHIAIVSISVFGFISLFSAINAEAVKSRFRSELPIKMIGGFMIAVSLVFAALWSALVVSRLRLGLELDPVSRLVITIDGVILLPLSFFAGFTLWRRRPVGYVLSNVLLVKMAATFLTLMFTTAVSVLWGQEQDLIQTSLYAVGLVGASMLLVRSFGFHTAIRLQIMESVWGAVQIAFHLGSGPLLHRWRTRWGATPSEIESSLPGDELIANPDWSYNHAITIQASRSAVWPWIMQMGQNRGGFYSYEGLENVIGCDIHNILEIRPELQALEVNDTIRLYRNGFGPRVAILVPERTLVLGGPADINGSGATWSFYLLDGPQGSTRLLERGRAVAGKGIAAKLGFGPYLMDPIGFVMSRKMLKTIKHLAEGPGIHGASAAA